MKIVIGKPWNIYSVILILQALYSLHPWFLWWIPNRLAIILQFLIAIIYFLAYPSFWDFNSLKKVGSALLILIIYIYWTFIDEGNFNYIIFRTLQSFSLIPLVLLKSRFQLDLLVKFQKVMAFILSASLLFWLLHLLGLDLPSIDVSYGTIETSTGSDSLYYFSNHFFYLVNQSWLMNNYDFLPSYLRFSSVFLEPGFLSILMVFLLFINKFDFKDKRNLIYILTIIASLSLAGFVMAIFAYVTKLFGDSKHRIISVTFFIISLFICFNFFKEYNNGQNVINKGIIERLEYDQANNTISGYNRTTGNFDQSFTDFMRSSYVLTGIGRQKMLQETGNYNVGIKPYIMSYGVVGLILFILFLILVARFGNNYHSYILLALYIIMFVRGDATMFWHSFILVYICGITKSKYLPIDYEKNSNCFSVQ